MIRTERLLLMSATEGQLLIPSIGVLEKAKFPFDCEGSGAHAPEGEVVLRYALTRERFNDA